MWCQTILWSKCLAKGSSCSHQYRGVMFHETRETQSCEGRHRGQISLLSLVNHKVIFFNPWPSSLLSHLDLGYSSNQGSQMRSNKYSILQWDFVDWSILKQHAQTQDWPPNWNVVQIQSEPFEPSSQMSPKKNFWATLSSNSKSRKKLIPCMKLPTLDSQQKCAKKQVPPMPRILTKACGIMVSCWATNRSFGPQNSWHDV